MGTTAVGAAAAATSNNLSLTQQLSSYKYVALAVILGCLACYLATRRQRMGGGAGRIGKMISGLLNRGSKKGNTPKKPPAKTKGKKRSRPETVSTDTSSSSSSSSTDSGSDDDSDEEEEQEVRGATRRPTVRESVRLPNTE
jgi:hypothetical protein